MQEAIIYIKQWVKLAGDLSTLMQLGQKGSKAATRLIGAGPLDSKTPQVFTWAHSFKDGKPTREEIPISIIHRGSDLDKRKYFENIVKPDAKEIELHEQLVTLANEGDENAIVRYLGIRTTLYADTKHSKMIWLKKMEGAIRKQARHL